MKTTLKRNVILIVLMLVSTVFVSVLVAQTLVERQDPKRAKAFMRQKLTYSQNVLEGLTLENYDLIITNGIKMFNMSQRTAWQARSTDEYKKYSATYCDSVSAMIDAAREKKINAAREAYCRSVQSCYDCHNYCKLVPPPGSASKAKQGK